MGSEADRLVRSYRRAADRAMLIAALPGVALLIFVLYRLFVSSEGFPSLLGILGGAVGILLASAIIGFVPYHLFARIFLGRTYADLEDLIVGTNSEMTGAVIKETYQFQTHGDPALEAVMHEFIGFKRRWELILWFVGLIVVGGAITALYAMFN